MVLPIAVVSGFILALLVPLVRRLLGPYAIVVFVATPALLAGLFVSLAPSVIDGEPVRWATEWVPQLRLAMSFSLDGLSLLFSLLITGIGVAVILYAEHYLHGHREIDRFHALALAFMASSERPALRRGAGAGGIPRCPFSFCAGRSATPRSSRKAVSAFR